MTKANAGIVKISRSDDVDPYIHEGVIVSQSRNLVQLHKIHDFQFDGYVVVSRKDITKTSPEDSYCEKLIRKAKLWKNPSKQARELPVNSWGSLFKALSKEIVIVENERKGIFYIGEIAKIKKDQVVIRHFDLLGEWQDEYAIGYKHITQVIYGCRYIKVHAGCLKRPPSDD
jgi:hypothetical protein